MKRGQVSVFLVVGLLIVIIVAFVLYLRTPVATPVPPQFSPVAAYIQSCVERSVDASVPFILLQGGYYHVPRPIKVLGLDTPRYMTNGALSFPDKSTIENELAGLIRDQVKKCTSGFAPLRSEGFIITAAEPVVVARLGKTVSATVNYPITVTRGAASSKLGDFIYRKEFDFDRYYGVVSSLMQEQEKHPSSMPLGYLGVLASANNATFNIDYYNDTVAYRFLFDNGSVIYNFAIDYTWRGASDFAIIPPERMLQAEPGYEFSHAMNATTPATWTSYSDVFRITPEGVIRFTPTEDDAGYHEVVISAQDANGDTDSITFTLHVARRNFPPRLDHSPDSTATVGRQWTGTLHAIDPDADTMLYDAQTGVAGFTIDPTTGKMTVTPHAGQEGNYTVRVSIVDVRGGTTTDNFKLEVRHA